MTYLYDYVGQPWKAQSRVRWAMGKLYAPTPAGYCGDEDNGQTSAWYVFSALGFYPVCPGDVNYVVGTPLFAQATITAENNGPLRPYIRIATLDGKSFDQTFLSHDELVTGGSLIFKMSSAPEKQWGSAPASRLPISVSRTS